MQVQRPFTCHRQPKTRVRIRASWPITDQDASTDDETQCISSSPMDNWMESLRNAQGSVSVQEILAQINSQRWCLGMLWGGYRDSVTGRGVETIVAAMQQHVCRCKIQEQGCRALAGLVESFEEIRLAQIADATFVGAILLAMRRHKCRPAVQEQGSRVLATVAGSMTLESAGVRNDIVDVVLRNMRRFKRKAQIQENCCRVLATLPATLPLHRNPGFLALPDARIYHEMLKTMRRHKLKARIQEYGCRVLATLAENLHFHHDPVTLVQTILTGMLCHEDVASVQLEGCRVLAELAGSQDKAKFIVQGAGRIGGGVTMILRAMRHHQVKSKVQEQGCRVLSALVENLRSYFRPNWILANRRNNSPDDWTEIFCHRSYWLDIINEFITPGSIEVTLVAMRRYKCRVTIQEQGCRVLAVFAEILCKHRDPRLAGTYTDLLVPAVLSAMRRHDSVSSVQEQGCRVLVSVTESILMHQNQRRLADMADVNFVDAILSAMCCHKRMASVQLEGCRVIEKLSTNVHIAYCLTEGGCVTLILEALENHRSDDCARRHGYGALANLASVHDKYRALICSAGAIEVLLSNIQNGAYKHDNGFALLAELARNNDIADKIAASGCIEAMLSVVQNTPEASDKSEAIEILATLARCDEHANRIAAAGGVEVIFSTLQRCEDPLVILIYGCDVLDKLARSEVHRESISTTDGIRIIVSTMLRFPRSPHLQDIGHHVLRTLACDHAKQKSIKSVIKDECTQQPGRWGMTSQHAEIQMNRMIALIFGPAEGIWISGAGDIECALADIPGHAFDRTWGQMRRSGGG